MANSLRVILANGQMIIFQGEKIRAVVDGNKCLSIFDTPNRKLLGAFASGFWSHFIIDREQI